MIEYVSDSAPHDSIYEHTGVEKERSYRDHVIYGRGKKKSYIGVCGQERKDRQKPRLAFVVDATLSMLLSIL